MGAGLASEVVGDSARQSLVSHGCAMMIRL